MAQQNVETKVNGNILTITVDLSKDFGPSKTGKTKIVASTGGFIEVAPGKVMNLNVNKKG